MSDIGLYIHIPFCKGKCPYCDFYSVRADKELMNRYTDRVIYEIEKYAEELGVNADTLYLGGGTPSIMNSGNLCRVIDAAVSKFNISGEVTVECNPSSDLSELFKSLSASGVNRVSIGLQSALDGERYALGRKATAADAQKAISDALKAGIGNISVDLMLGIPKQTNRSLRDSIRFCAESGVSHISAYMLKIEENTYFWKIQDKLELPSEDEVCDLYLETCFLLEEYGFNQYEISNFSKPGYESEHNLKYWNADEYLGLGPSAHSFLNGKRFFFERDIDNFIASPEPKYDGDGGSFEEYVMLRLRLSEGLKNEDVVERYGFNIPDRLYENAGKFEKMGLLVSDHNSIRLSRKGFLLSNSIISGILYD